MEPESESSNTSNTRNNKVLLFRAPKHDSEDLFEKELLAHQFIPISVPVLQFNFINISKFATCLCSHDDYSAIVFTSPRAVEAASRALQVPQGSKEESEKKRRVCPDMKCYVVGDGTYKTATECGFSPVRTDAGNAEKLAECLIQEMKVKNKPLLYPCGNLRRDTLSAKLKNAGFDLQEVEVYETGRSSTLENDIKQAILKQGIPDFVVYFSPSGVQFTMEMSNSDLLPLKNLKVVAIGPTTEKELIHQGVHVYSVATNPDPSGVIRALQAQDH